MQVFGCHPGSTEQKIRSAVALAAGQPNPV